ncbi:MAG: class I SAM-dependent methyltransferase [bacterium]
MIRKHITKPVEKWVKQKIRNTYNEIDSAKLFKKKIESAIFFPYLEDAQTYVIKRDFTDLNVCEYGLPIPPQSLWLGYGKTIEEYLYGKIQIEQMISILEAAAFDISKCKAIMDFGCGAGRMLRWLFPFSGTSEIWGTDISAEHIFWANDYLKPPFNFATTTTIPHLPFEDRYFNLIYAGSVFTHIDDLVEAWLMELKRIINSDGRLYITIHDKHSIELLKTSPLYSSLWLSHYIRETPAFIEAGDKFDKIVGMRGTRSQVFYDIDYFCDSVKNFFDIISVNREAYGFQTGILMKRK